jgi:1,2-diacylglycerol 3-alpha-glucosyltransferase
MRIIIAGQTYHPAANGQSVFTVQLAEGLAASGHQVMVIAPSDQRQAESTVLNGVELEKVRSVSFFHMQDTYLNMPAGQTVARLMDGFRPDIVHIQDHYPLAHTVVSAARKRHIPLVGTNHFLPENVLHYLGLPAWVTARLERAAWFWVLELYNRLQIVTTPTETAAAILRQQPIRVPVYAVSCGVDLARFAPDPTVDRAALRLRYRLDPERTVFMYVGRLDQEKRIDVLMRAIKQLKRDDLQLAVAGHGRYMDVLLAMAQQMNLGQRVVFTGYIPAEDLPGLLNSVDVFAMPSEAELQSIATLEAMACGKPVLAANARALPELVEDGVNGYLFAPGNAEDAARCIAQLADERERWPAMSAAGLARVSQHSVGDTVRRYTELYRKLLPAAGAAGRVSPRPTVTEHLP